MWNVLLFITMMNPANGQTYVLTTPLDVSFHQCVVWGHVMAADVVKQSAFPEDQIVNYHCELAAR